MPLTLRNVPEGVDEVGLKRMAQAAMLLRSNEAITVLLSQLQSQMIQAVGETEQADSPIHGELHNLQFLLSAAVKQLDLFLQFGNEFSDQFDESITKLGIEVTA